MLIADRPPRSGGGALLAQRGGRSAPALPRLSFRPYPARTLEGPAAPPSQLRSAALRPSTCAQPLRLGAQRRRSNRRKRPQSRSRPRCGTLPQARRRSRVRGSGGSGHHPRQHQNSSQEYPVGEHYGGNLAVPVQDGSCEQHGMGPRASVPPECAPAIPSFPCFEAVEQTKNILRSAAITEALHGA